MERANTSENEVCGVGGAVNGGRWLGPSLRRAALRAY